MAKVVRSITMTVWISANVEIDEEADVNELTCEMSNIKIFHEAEELKIVGKPSYETTDTTDNDED